ncbi:aldehyde dehydrogenase family protein [Limimaricola litoreus]|uniref:Aldehyde dehydrogenase family protein n=1 Tax=Limimaricola litoreus TaxID=2955316 RepID=A0A9X2FPZ5_9RHOB|nr:aldehyde dehydrogenase family protein [Limimaricola litoreus]MCP1169567.1 aldehyde dehydrogenase family protein [Limimaricola litoreus]
MKMNDVTKQHRNLIAGEWVESADVNENRNPANTDEIVGLYARASKDDAARAIAAARAAFPAWSKSGPQQRHDLLKKVSDTIAARAEELGELLAREEGKTFAEAKGEVMRASQVFGFFAGETLRQTGDAIDSVRPGVEVMVQREALGVIGLITPWNFPIAIPAWKIAPALAFGNCVVIKPADLTPGCAWALAEIIHEAGAPEGVFNLVMGRGSEIGAEILDSPEVDAVSFTGSVETGRMVAEKCVAQMKKVQLEMGGKNPLVVLDDADLDTAVNCALNGAFFSTGQRCTASSRLIVTAGIHDRFVAALTEKLNSLKVGDPMDGLVHIGPVVDESQLEQNRRYVKIGQEEGATLVCGGEVIEGATPGHFMTPALFTGTTNEMRINREEIFGPVATVIKVADYDEALRLANDTDFGLSAGICTTNLGHAAHFRRNAEAGMVMVNLPTAGVDYHTPFGGRKGSSYGPREQGQYAREFYTTVKTTYIQA